MADARPAPGSAAPGLVANPEYERWSNCAPGAWALWQGFQLDSGQRTPLAIRTTLVSRDEHRVVIERQFEVDPGARVVVPLQGRFVLPARIPPAEHPVTAELRTRTELPPRDIQVGAQQLTCAGYRIRAPGEFPQWGADVDLIGYTNDAVPGRFVALELNATLAGSPVTFSGTVTAFGAE
jgi:hypothetical protein